MSVDIERIKLRTELSNDEMVGVSRAMKFWRSTVQTNTSIEESDASRSDLFADAKTVHATLQRLLNLQLDTFLIGMQSLLRETPFDSDRMGRDILKNVSEVQKSAADTLAGYRQLISNHRTEPASRMPEVEAMFRTVITEAEKLRVELLRSWPLSEPSPEFLEASRSAMNAGEVISIEDMIAELK